MSISTMKTLGVFSIFCLVLSLQVNAQPRIGGEIVFSETGTTLTAMVKVNAINGANYGLGPSTLKFEYNSSEVILSGSPSPGTDFDFAPGFGAPYSNSVTRPNDGEASINVFIFGGAGRTLDSDLQDLVEINFELRDPVRFSLASFDFTWSLCEHSDTGFNFSINDCTGFGEVALPVELSSFDFEQDERSVNLNWTTSSERDNAGFEIEYASESGPFVEAAYVDGAGTTTDVQNYSYSFENLLPGNYQFRLKQIDFDGKHSYSEVLSALVGIPGEFILDNAYPNPFNPQTTVNFAVRESQQVRYELYDPTGRLVKILFDQGVEAGKNQQIQIDASDLPSGVYIGLLVGETFRASQRLVLAK